MDVSTVAVIAAAVFVWGIVSARLERADLTAPIVFVAVGVALAGAGLVDGPAEPEALTPLVEITLVWVLFSDAARLPCATCATTSGAMFACSPSGCPSRSCSGGPSPRGFCPGPGLWLALFVGAALAPTDAALGIPVVTNPVVPSRIRQLITVESGLNDGIATPVVMVAIAGAAATAASWGEGAGHAVVQLALGVVVASAVGAAGGWLLRLARRRDLAAEDFTGIAVLALGLLAPTPRALALDGNGFVAAFCGGLAFGACAGRRGPAELVFLEQTGELVSSLVWLAFGAVAVPIMLDRRRPADAACMPCSASPWCGCCPCALAS